MGIPFENGEATCENMIALTCDTDWAPDDVVDYFLSTVNDFQVKLTFFCTHHIDIHGGHELAVHPNYKPEEPYEETLKKLLKLAKNILLS